MHFGSLAEMFGMDGIIVLIVVVLVLFGSSQIPKLARSLGSAHKEFRMGIHDGAGEEANDGRATGPVKTVVEAQPLETMAAPTTDRPASGDRI